MGDDNLGPRGAADWAQSVLPPALRDETKWLCEAMATLRPSQRDHFSHVVRLQSNDLRTKIWSAFHTHGGANAVTTYVHDILRVYSYLHKTFSSSSAAFTCLTQLHAAFAAPWERSSMEELLVATTNLPTFAALFQDVPPPKQQVYLDVASEHVVAFEAFLAWLKRDPDARHSVHILFGKLDNDNFELWVTCVVVRAAPAQRDALVRVLHTFHASHRLPKLANVFFAHGHHADLVTYLVNLSATDLHVADTLLPQLSAASSAILITSMKPFAASLQALADHPLPNPAMLERLIGHLALVSDVNMTSAINMWLQFVATRGLDECWRLLDHYLALDTTTSTRLLHVVATLPTEDHAHLATLLLLLLEETPPDCLAFTSAAVQFPLHDLQVFLQVAAQFSATETCRVVKILAAPLPLPCLAPFLALLDLPHALRPLLYASLDSLDDVSPLVLVQTLLQLWRTDAAILEDVLRHVASYDPDPKRSLCATVLQLDSVDLNRRVLLFLLAPPADMERLGCLRLLLHVPPATYDSILSLFQHPERTSLELLVFSDMLLGVDTPETIHAVLRVLGRLDDTHLHAFFVYLEHVDDATALVEILNDFSLADVQLYLDLAVGLSQSMLRELNAFVLHLTLPGRTALLKLIPNPRRHILSRLIMSIHTLDNHASCKILQALEHHTWDYRSLLVEQFRIIDDPTALAQLVAIHETLGDDSTTRYQLETYAMLASYCSKATQMQLIAVLYRMFPPDRTDFVSLIRNHAAWQPTEAIAPGFWTEDRVAKLCALLLKRNSTVAAHLVHLLGKLAPSFHEHFLHTCRDLSPDMAYFTSILHRASVAQVHALTPLLFSLDETNVCRLGRCMRQMLKHYDLDMAVQVLLAMPRLPRFLAYFDKTTSPSRFVQVLAAYHDTTAAVVAFLGAMDMDDATLVTQQLLSLDPERKARLETLLRRPGVRMTGQEKALYLSVLDGSHVLSVARTDDKRLLAPRTTPTAAPLAPLDPVWSWQHMAARSLSRKAKRVGQCKFDVAAKRTPTHVHVEKEYYSLSLLPNREGTVSLATPLRDDDDDDVDALMSLMQLQVDRGDEDDNQGRGGVDDTNHCVGYGEPESIPTTLTTVDSEDDHGEGPSPFSPLSGDENGDDDDGGDDDDPPSSPEFHPSRLFDHVLQDSHVKRPLHTVEEEYLDARGNHLPRLHRHCRKPPSSSKALRGIMPAIQREAMQTTKRRPSSTPSSPYSAIAGDSNLCHWPPTRIRVAKTSEAKQKVFDARIRKNMGVPMPLLVPTKARPTDVASMRRSSSCPSV
ncbi:Aste57867_16916 [Aphanomyces stellatus]|uniref:Aste57867_16916 protein n=1 Tax=Aphanomyces stellatus TaxID=120398 RepID=A0A485L6J0_9STRA|nr:hypothetical protein As57867_016858 [Aphanomyces stellatus]VFT93678.1 Aste57867_16916 [Aphanomyces stellatus]